MNGSLSIFVSLFSPLSADFGGRPDMSSIDAFWNPPFIWSPPTSESIFIVVDLVSNSIFSIFIEKLGNDNDWCFSILASSIVLTTPLTFSVKLDF